MYWSLERVCKDFHLYIFAFDDACYDVMTKLNLKHATIISLKEFEDPELLRVKPTRTPGEYCWTCSSSVIKYCIEHYNLDNCTGIDADLYFFADPTCLIEEMGNADVLLTEHRYSPNHDVAAKSGKYCVQFSTFKNTPNGMKILNWWRDACLEWCYNRYEPGRFGDQMYLDDWMTHFENVHELQHLGGGVAPWNMQQYEFRKEGEQVVGRELKTGKEFPLVFFHFHACHCYNKWRLCEFNYSWYDWDKQTWDILFKRYVKDLIRASRTLHKTNKEVNGVAMQEQPIQNWWTYLMRIRRRIFVEHDFRYCYWIA